LEALEAAAGLGMKAEAVAMTLLEEGGMGTSEASEASQMLLLLLVAGVMISATYPQATMMAGHSGPPGCPSNSSRNSTGNISNNNCSSSSLAASSNKCNNYATV
jgi:hypothetical protein